VLAFLTLYNAEAISATSNNMKLVHWPLMMGGTVGCYIWYSDEGPGRAAAPPSPLLAVPNVAATYPLTTSIPITALLYSGPLVCAVLMRPLKG